MELQKEKKILNESYGKDALEAPVNDIRNILEREVTWTALPTISGFAIIAWNVLNYFFTLLSSLMIFSKTNVPVYLLMKRTNTDFASGYLLYATIITVLWFYAVSRYNVEGRFVHIIGFFLVIIVALSDIVGVRSLIYGKVLSPMTFGAGVIFAYLSRQ